MLSYQHIYHAGNAADFHKHVLLAAMLDYMTRKDKPLTYIETHAGRGLYDLSAPEALKTAEAEAGVGAFADSLDADHPYIRALRQTGVDHGRTSYPGSPLVAATLLRPQDRLHLAELHPQEFAALEGTLSRRAKLYNEDGFEMAQKVTPPTPRRGALLIDPPYEVKSDYEKIPTHISKLHRKWNVGVIALWYPILTTGAHTPMLGKLESLKLPGTLRHEVRFPPAKEGHKMLGSGMFVVNAPYGLNQAAASLDSLFAGSN